MNQAPPLPAIDAETCYQQLLAQLRAHLKPGDFLVGVQSKGVKIAKRLHQDLGLGTPLGTISSSMHRDDYTLRGLSKAELTQLPFDVDHAQIVLVDDVLFTGRTTRALLNELFDFGRPERIWLAVLVDRGGRQLPIQADFCAQHIDLPPHTALVLNQDENGRFDFVLNASTH